eukprot:jgi/Mesvir1/3558/Mv12024-RA.1
MAQVLTCNTCNVSFQNEDVQRVHYRDEWHRYNLKRKVAGLPCVTQAWYQAKTAASEKHSAMAAAPAPTFSCGACGKHYSSEGAYTQHMSSKRHLETVARGGSAPAQPRVIKSADSTSPAVPVAEIKGGEEEESDGEDEWEEVEDEEEASAMLADMEARGGGGAAEAPIEVWDAKRCLFCVQRTLASTQECVEHMHREHGFFIPDAEFLVDPEGLLEYLGIKISQGLFCLYCDGRGRSFADRGAVLRHMASKSHCKMRYGDEETAEEFEDFYDFEKSNEDGDGDVGMQLVAADAEPEVEVTAGLELVLTRPGGDAKVLGHRDYARYYKQKPKPRETHEGVLVNELLARYRALGVATRFEGQRAARHRANDAELGRVRRYNDHSFVVAVHNDKIFKLPKNVTY